jgi:hypothetical protein
MIEKESTYLVEHSLQFLPCLIIFLSVHFIISLKKWDLALSVTRGASPLLQSSLTTFLPNKTTITRIEV